MYTQSEIAKLDRQEFLHTCRNNPNLASQWVVQAVPSGLPAIWYQVEDDGVLQALSDLQLSTCGVPSFVKPSKRLRIIAQLTSATIFNHYGNLSADLTTCFAPQSQLTAITTGTEQYYPDVEDKSFIRTVPHDSQEQDRGSASMSLDELEEIYRESDFNAYLVDATYAEYLFASNQAKALRALLASCQSAQERAAHCQNLANSHLCAAALVSMASSGNHDALKAIANFPEGAYLIAKLDIAYFIAVACEHDNNEFADLLMKLSKQYYQDELGPEFFSAENEDDIYHYNNFDTVMDKHLFVDMINSHFSRLFTPAFLLQLVERQALQGFTWLISQLSPAECETLRQQWQNHSAAAALDEAYENSVGILKHQRSYEEFTVLSKQCMNDMILIQRYSHKMLLIALDNELMSKLLHTCVTQAARIRKQIEAMKTQAMPYDHSNDYSRLVHDLRTSHRSMMGLLQQLHTQSCNHFCKVASQDSSAVQAFVAAHAGKYQQHQATILSLKAKVPEHAQAQLTKLAKQVGLDQELVAKHNTYNTAFMDLCFADDCRHDQQALTARQQQLSLALESHAALLRLTHDHHILIAFCLHTANDEIFKGDLRNMLPSGINGLRHDALLIGKKVIKLQARIIEQALDANLAAELHSVRAAISAFQKQTKSRFGLFKSDNKQAALTLDQNIFKVLMMLKSARVKDPRTGERQPLTRHQVEALLYADDSVAEKLSAISALPDLKLGYPALLASFPNQGLSGYDVLYSFRNQALS